MGIPEQLNKIRADKERQDEVVKDALEFLQGLKGLAILADSLHLERAIDSLDDYFYETERKRDEDSLDHLIRQYKHRSDLIKDTLDSLHQLVEEPKNKFIISAIYGIIFTSLEKEVLQGEA